jgi:hypothetical protein
LDVDGDEEGRQEGGLVRREEAYALRAASSSPFLRSKE